MCVLLSHIRFFVTPWTVAHQAPLSMRILHARILEWVDMPSSRVSSQPKNKPRSPALQADSLPSEPPGKPKNTGVCSLSLLQGISLTQKLNQGVLHCRQILYQLGYQGSPHIMYRETLIRKTEDFRSEITYARMIQNIFQVLKE